MGWENNVSIKLYLDVEGISILFCKNWWYVGALKSLRS